MTAGWEIKNSSAANNMKKVSCEKRVGTATVAVLARFFDGAESRLEQSSRYFLSCFAEKLETAPAMSSNQSVNPKQTRAKHTGITGRGGVLASGTRRPVLEFGDNARPESAPAG